MSSEKSEGMHTCPVCKAGFSTMPALMEHVSKAHPQMAQTMGSHMEGREVTRAKASTYFGWAALGGFVGAILMGIVMMIAAAAMGVTPLIMMLAMGIGVFGLSPTGGIATAMGGLILHLVDGVVIGLILAAISFGVKRFLFIDSVKRGAYIGLLAGFLVWLVFGLPVLLAVMPHAMVVAIAAPIAAAKGVPISAVAPTVQSKLIPMMGPIAGAFLVAHLVYGLLWGVFIGYAVSRRV
ncbi:hypothetical protein B9Q11_02485 [Candidatus Marsarchaeota G2 archaeon ECH_B_SAG-F08]|uniref:C2H2-type domain-containing protein n=2 Tax=Candidatus Marsarchaeota group 2 TaxID=2203771 RepID=A0A2R6BIL3_9ARCH|nr:MAG: hypothetical protein B9Q11_02485 [Candidatus Marsarchaeota G2 archaeon ECH_B_SAG-F08]